MLSSVFILASLFAASQAQQVGTVVAEVHPPLTVSKCTASGCTTSQQSVVIDSNWRWLHNVGGYTNCYTGNTFNPTYCPNGVACAANCALEGAEYGAVYGISTSGSSLRLNFVTKGANTNVGSRTYLMAAGSQTQYQILQLLNQEFTFDVDVSKLPCGLNGALYFSEMDADGGLSKFPGNKAGARYGTGYCDAQCPQDIKFINGEANSDSWNGTPGDANAGLGKYGSCCNEMDIWEANSISTAYTPHPCNTVGQVRCTGTDCGIGARYSSLCDADGCDINPYRMGNTTFYGPGKTIDTTRPMTVVTQFLTDTGTSAGTLNAIRRFYVQNGFIYPSPNSNIAGVPGADITDAFCDAQKAVFGDQNIHKARGGLAKMSAALRKGMVLVMSIWDDHNVSMLWLDAPFPTTANTNLPGIVRGTCSINSGKWQDVERDSPDSTVTFSNIKWGPIGSTFSGTLVGGGGGGSSSSSTRPASSSTRPVSSSTRPASTSSTRPTTSSTRPASTSSTRPASTTTRPTTSSTRTSVAPTSTAGGATAPRYAQCGGQGYTGPTVCASPWVCTYSNPYYSQCL